MIGIIFLAIVYFIVLELSKNTLTGWFLAILVTACYLVIRGR